MSDIGNPYASPTVTANPESASSLGAGVITPLMKETLKATSPWMVFMGVIGFVGAGFMALAGLIMAVAMGAAGRMAGEIPGMPAAFGAMGPLLGLIYIGAAVLIIFPSRFLYISGTKMKAYYMGESSADLEAALVASKSYWKFNGILVIVYLAIIPIAMIVSVAVALIGVAANL